MRAGEGLSRCRHAGPGTYDETARRVGHAELAVAELLMKEGHHVKSLPEGRGPGRSADFLACGVLVEAKSFMPLAERSGRSPSAQAVANKMLDARGQGAVAVIWAVGSGLPEPVARSGYLMFCERARLSGLGRLRSVRVVGEGFDVTFDPVVDLRAGWQVRGHVGLGAGEERSPRQPQKPATPAKRGPEGAGLASAQPTPGRPAQRPTKPLPAPGRPVLRPPKPGPAPPKAPKL